MWGSTTRSRRVDPIAKFPYSAEGMANDLGTCYRSWGRRFVLGAGKLVIPHTGSMRRARAASSRLAGRTIPVNIAIRSHRRRVVWFHTKGE